MDKFIIKEQATEITVMRNVFRGPAGPRGERGQKGEQGDPGQDGTVSFDELTPEQRESLVGPQGPAGVEGKQGPAGNDGVSPSVVFDTIEGGHAMTVTDVAHPGGQTIEIMDGVPGPEGPGIPAGGAVGQIPVKRSAADYDLAWEYPRYPRRNLLVNCYFVGGGSHLGDGLFPINQRGQTSYSNGGGSIDRWFVRSGLSCEVNANGLTLMAGDSVSGVFYQYLDSSADLRGKQVCLSGQIGDIVYSGSSVIPSDIPASNTVILSVSIPNGYLRIRVLTDGKIECVVNVSTSQTIAEIKAVKLELGSYQTLAHEENGVWVLNELPDFGEELAKCQRYYYPIPYALRFNATYRSAGVLDFIVPIPQIMIGTVSMAAPNCRLYAYDSSTGDLVVQSGFTFSVLEGGTGNGFVTIRANKSSHGLVSNPVVLIQPYTSAYFSTET